MITLGIGRMEIDWGKNNSTRDHSALFKPSDIKQIPYYYVDGDSDKPIVEMKEGYARKLSTIKMRLDLLGYDIQSSKSIFETTLHEHEDYGYEILLTFDIYYSALKSINIAEVDTIKFEIDGYENGYDFGEYFRDCVLENPQIKDKILNKYEDVDTGRRNPTSDLAQFLENLDPYVTLRILAENPNNSDFEVHWSLADLVENGWAKRDEIIKGLLPKNKLLIVTEGSSDSFVLRKAIDELYPDISDFFDFVDMKENYPFTGTGSLYNFCMGLCRINIQNNIMVIFDNDTAGVEKYNLASTLIKPLNFLITKLPDHSDFSNIQTLGPQGYAFDDINGKAVAIECFLDFNSVLRTQCVRWTAYNKNQKQYQGELENKDDYVRAFKQCNLTNGSYDTQKLKFLVEFLIRQWIDKKYLTD
jgi:hypothetical protein